MSRETTVVGGREGSCGHRSSSVASTNNRISAIRRETTVGGDREFREAADVGEQGGRRAVAGIKASRGRR
jgi:hypothetical protein